MKQIEKRITKTKKDIESQQPTLDVMVKLKKKLAFGVGYRGVRTYSYNFGAFLAG